MPSKQSSDARTARNVPNKTKWALREIDDACAAAERAWSKAMERAEKHMDVVMMLNLAKMRDELAVIRRKAHDALEGKYEG